MDKDKRVVPQRNRTETSVVCRPFTSGMAIHAAEGVMRNFSAEGLYVETSREFKPGAILLLRMEHFPPASPSPAAVGQPPSICLAEVKWRQELATENTNRYGIGLRYLD